MGKPDLERVDVPGREPEAHFGRITVFSAWDAEAASIRASTGPSGPPLRSRRALPSPAWPRRARRAEHIPRVLWARPARVAAATPRAGSGPRPEARRKRPAESL